MTTENVSRGTFRRNARLDVAVIRSQRLQAAGARESILYATGRPILPHRPRVFATLGAYLAGLAALVGVLSLLCRQF